MKALRIVQASIGVVLIAGAIWIVLARYSEVKPSRPAVRYATFEWPGDRAVKQIEITYTATDSTSKKKRFSTLAGALEDLEQNGWTLKTSGATCIVTTEKRSAPDVFLIVSRE